MPTNLISLLAFGQPHIPSTNDKQQDLEVCLNHVCCRLILGEYRKMHGCVGTSGQEGGEGVKSATHVRDQERPAPHGFMLTHHDPQECIRCTAHHWQPWGCAGYGWLSAARGAPGRWHTATLHFAKHFCVITTIPHRHNHTEHRSWLPDEGVMERSPSPSAHPGWAASVSERRHLWDPAHCQDTF